MNPLLIAGDCAASRQKAFTLVEVLVASALGALIATTLLGVIGSLLGTWNHAQGRLVAASQAQRVLDQLALDLNGAMCLGDGGVLLAATIQATNGSSGAWVAGSKPEAQSFNPSVANLALARFGVAGVWLRFFTTRPGIDPRTGDGAAPVAVSYQIVRRAKTPGSSENCYLFYRAEATAAATHATGADLSATAYSEASIAEGAPGNLLSPPLGYALAENVIDFGVRFYAADFGTTTPSLIFPISATSAEHLARSVDGPVEERMPWLVDVMIRILTDEGARQIAALENNQIVGDWWAIAEAHSAVFTRRIVVMAATP